MLLNDPAEALVVPRDLRGRAQHRRVVAVYPLCRWFAAVKQRRRDWWLSYL